MFGCEIENYYRLFWDIRNRSAKDPAFLINRLHEALCDRIFPKENTKKT
jgi:hypothetical protein